MGLVENAMLRKLWFWMLITQKIHSSFPQKKNHSQWRMSKWRKSHQLQLLLLNHNQCCRRHLLLYVFFPLRRRRGGGLSLRLGIMFDYLGILKRFKISIDEEGNIG